MAAGSSVYRALQNDCPAPSEYSHPLPYLDINPEKNEETDHLDPQPSRDELWSACRLVTGRCETCETGNPSGVGPSDILREIQDRMAIRDLRKLRGGFQTDKIQHK